MILLYKKNDPEELKNWRPLSLINSDAKLFTKWIANQLKPKLSKIIHPRQTGFMPGAQISDYGWILQAMMEQQRDLLAHTGPAHIKPWAAACLDQEKAYDRIHPDYMQIILIRFGLPELLINTLKTLFFETKIHLSINGTLSAPFR